MDRKTFITTCGAICLSGGSLAPILQGCVSATYHASAPESGGTVTLARSEFTEVRGIENFVRPFILLKVASLNRPICVYRTGPNEFTALSTTCTHRGCEVRPNEEYLACPCHGSEFSITGEVLHGPAETALKRYPATVDHENIYIRL